MRPTRLTMASGPVGSWPSRHHSHAGFPSRLTTALSMALDSRVLPLAVGTGEHAAPCAVMDSLPPLCWWQRTLLRSSYVAAVCLLAIVIPLFSTVLSLLGALTFW